MELKPEDRALGLEIDREHAAELKQEERIVEALLFAMGRAVSLPELAAALDADEVLAKAAAERLLKEYEARQGGMLIRRVEAAYQLCTNPLCYDALIRVVSHPKKPVLSDVVLETLAIIAYKQPVTKAEIERIRGVQSDHAVNRLVEYGLVEESGRLNAPGRPALFVTTEEFLRRFGMESLKELPALSEDMAAEIEAQVAEEVSDVLGTDPETLQEELKSQRPETLVSVAAEEDNAAMPELPVLPVKPAAARKRETAAVREAVEAEQREEQEAVEAAAPAPAVLPVVTAATVLDTAVSAAEALLPQEEKTEIKSEPEASQGTRPLRDNPEITEVGFADRKASDALAAEASQGTRPSRDNPEITDDETLDQMIYEAAVGTESTAEQHYSFLEEGDAEFEMTDVEDVTEDAAPADAEDVTEDAAPADAEELTEEAEDDEVLAPTAESTAESTEAEAEESEAETGPESELAESTEVETEESGAENLPPRSSGRHHSIFDSVQVLSEAELREIEEEERRFRESLKGLPPRKRKPENPTEATETASEITEAEENAPAEPEVIEAEQTEAAAPENTESENTEAANAGSPEN